MENVRRVPTRFQESGTPLTLLQTSLLLFRSVLRNQALAGGTHVFHFVGCVSEIAAIALPPETKHQEHERGRYNKPKTEEQVRMRKLVDEVNEKLATRIFHDSPLVDANP